MDGTAEQARRARWRRSAVLAALMLAAFTFNTAENLPIGLLELIAESLRVSVPAVGLLVTGYGVTVAVASVPLAHVMRGVASRTCQQGLTPARAPRPAYRRRARRAGAQPPHGRPLRAVGAEGGPGVGAAVPGVRRAPAGRGRPAVRRGRGSR